MSKKVKIILLTLIFGLGIGLLALNYVFNGGARDLSTEKTQFTTSSKNITSEFTANIEAANKKYLEKAVAISGSVTEVKDSVVILDQTVICNFKSLDNSVKKDQKVTIKGRVVGYDDLMGELKLDQCFINKN